MDSKYPTFEHPKEEIPPLPPPFVNPFTDSCIQRSIVSAIFGGLFGSIFGLVLGGNIGVVPPNLQNAPIREQIRDGLRNARSASWSGFKNFGKIGFLFAGIECYAEQVKKFFIFKIAFQKKVS